MRITIELDDDEARALLKSRSPADLLGVGAYGAMQINNFLEACNLAEQKVSTPPTDLTRWIDASIRAMVLRVEQIPNAPPRPRLVLEGSVMSFSFIA